MSHFKDNYSNDYVTYDLTRPADFEDFMKLTVSNLPIVGVINYELAFRRPRLKKLENFTLMLDESSMIQNETAKRTKFILSMKPESVILLSGTPTGGKYEKLYTQLKLLGYEGSKWSFWNQFVNYKIDNSQGFPLVTVFGYKNEDRLKKKMSDLGCHFLKTDGVFDLPDQVEKKIQVPTTDQYKIFKKQSIVYLSEDFRLIGDTTLTKMLYERQLCGQYNLDKLSALRDLLQSSEDRMIIFYNFDEELRLIKEMCGRLERPTSEINGHIKDLKNWEEKNNTVLLGQYQAASMGHNLQAGNKIIYFTPPLSSELFEQSKKRTNRIGQTKTCFYYYLVVKGSIEEKIYKNLAMRRDYTNKLFERGE